MADEEENFEVIDLSAAAYRRNRGYLQQLIGDISKQSAAKQVVIGGAAGCASGYLSVKVGKSAAITVGVTILLIRVLRLFVYKSWQNSCLQFRNYSTSHTGLYFCAQTLYRGGTLTGGHISSYCRIVIAQHQGYIQINWSRVNREVGQARRRVEHEANRQYPQLIKNLCRFAQENMFLAGSFVGGFFLGLAF